MNSWLIGVFSLIGTTILTSVIGVIVKKSFQSYFRKRDIEEEARQAEREELEAYRANKRREERNADIEAMLKVQLKPITDSLETIKKGTQAGLRHDLYQIYDEWESKGYCPREVKADFENLYQSYHNLGKNGVMDNCYNKLMNYPDNKPENK